MLDPININLSERLLLFISNQIFIKLDLAEDVIKKFFFRYIPLSSISDRCIMIPNILLRIKSFFCLNNNIQ